MSRISGAVSVSAAAAAAKQPTVIASLEKKPLLAPKFDPGRASFSLHVGGIESSLATIPAFVLPGGVLEFSASGGSGAFTVETAKGTLVSESPKSWKWTAPGEHGEQAIRIRDARAPKTSRPILLQVFVLRPYDGNGTMGKYKIGKYRRDSKDAAYSMPAGFVEVTAQNIDTHLTPHFRLGQFLCKDTSAFPKYVALQTALLIKLEMLIEALAERGLPAETLHVMSGYRTPAYNAGIGNETTFSRHAYGDAADVFLDRDGDGKQDDLNNDGASTKEDANILFKLVEDVLEPKQPVQLAGGMSAYKPNHAHGPFLHIDTRGKKARW